MSKSQVEEIKRLKRMINILVYTSAIIDILIFLATASTLAFNFSAEHLLLPLNILLSIVVVLTILLGLIIVLIRHYQKIFFAFFEPIRVVNKLLKELTKNKKHRYQYKPK